MTELELLRQYLREAVDFQSTGKSPTIHDYGRWRRLLDQVGTTQALAPTEPDERRLHLFEFWWSEHMPEAAQSSAWAAWTDAQNSKGATIEAAKTATPERKGEPVAKFDEMRGRPVLLPKSPMLAHGDLLYTSPQVPEGYALVPVEPTLKMQSAALPYVMRQHQTRSIWAAMLDAARKGE